MKVIILPLTNSPIVINKKDLKGFNFSSEEIKTAVHAPVMGKGILTNIAKPIYVQSLNFKLFESALSYHFLKIKPNKGTFLNKSTIVLSEKKSKIYTSINAIREFPIRERINASNQ
tara:strand:+ start:4043 stop:4390 length:348 start_codon:yes stop_codon:yes gene_type:complete